MYKDDLGERMKAYEELSDIKLINRLPVIIRIDGRSFHTFTKGFNRPFDNLLGATMGDTLKYLCENISNCAFGYTQSDEITLVLINNTEKPDLNTPWFGNRVQKLSSVAASMATFIFNRSFSKHLKEEYEIFNKALNRSAQKEKLFDRYFTAAASGATFDCRTFVVPDITEAVNCLIWQQQDASKNSILNLGHSYFTNKELHGKSCSDIQQMLLTEHNINWNDQSTVFKRGLACIRVDKQIDTPHGPIIRKKWELDTEMPILTQDREYLIRQFNV